MDDEKLVDGLVPRRSLVSRTGLAWPELVGLDEMHESNAAGLPTTESSIPFGWTGEACFACLSLFFEE